MIDLLYENRWIASFGTFYALAGLYVAIRGVEGAHSEGEVIFPITQIERVLYYVAIVFWCLACMVIWPVIVAAGLWYWYKRRRLMKRYAGMYDEVFGKNGDK